jgi:lipoate-protein ligase A
VSGRWRLIIDPDAPGARNMAVDEALLLTGPGCLAAPTLRLYGWDPHTLSLGANQDASTVDVEALERDGYGLVRRPTGGRAILHAEELTYSVTAPAPEGGTLSAYRWIARGLRGGLARLGVDVQMERMSRPQARDLDIRHPCFTAAGRYELTAEGRKVVGSAQRRRGGWLMQHGSILLGDEHLRLTRYLGSSDPDREAALLRASTTDLSTLAGFRLTRREVVHPFAAGFAEALGVDLEPGGLLEAESSAADELERERFATTAWTLHADRGAVVLTGSRES